MVQSYTGTVVESRADWLTLTSAGTEERLALADLAQTIVTAQHNAGDDAKPWARWGYSGFGTKHAHWGERPDTDILILSGTLADDNLATVVPLASHISRVDVCVTTRLPDADDSLIVEGYLAGQSHIHHGGHKPAYELLQHSRRGATLYIGSRTSRQFGRLYNKHRESELAYYSGCYRYEVEQKNNVADRGARALAVDPDRGGTIQRQVYAYFDQRGVCPAFDPSSGRLPSQPFRPHSDNQRRLLWLSGQVRKTVEQLRKAGLEDQARFALGFD